MIFVLDVHGKHIIVSTVHLYMYTDTVYFQLSLKRIAKPRLLCRTYSPVESVDRFDRVCSRRLVVGNGDTLLGRRCFALAFWLPRRKPRLHRSEGVCLNLEYSGVKLSRPSEQVRAMEPVA